MSRSLLLIGTGLVGGSFALAARANGLFDRVVGVDRDAGALAEALRLGVVDETADSLPGDCDAACVAVPVGGIAVRVREAARRAPLVFDVGSVKQPILDALAPPPGHYVPCHPLAGSERSGVAAADATLFRGRAVALTPVAATNAAAIASVRGYWERLGARVVVESPGMHDDRVAMLSHLPHLLAFAFLETAGRGHALESLGEGFRDFTRIGAADGAMWADILHANGANVRRHLEAVIASLRGFAATEDRSALRRRIEAAASVRRGLDAPAS